ncbi:chemotaxis protein CheX [Paenibacillus turpanensis]|uniref:chemotaxis protein CheX n=1 Tax=Paenibacillus turpanensis TaxID=2689078 RepID=UPI0014088FD6|nr:chemotaxis protein CheX [Paenibacillus turpanensis]
MKAEHINPFLESARLVIEQVANVKPTTGQLGVKDVKLVENHVWIQIGVKGQMSGDIVFGFHESVAIRMASAMMGGFELAELDEIGQSAISELGNMISGNASTMLFNQGVEVDITPPKLLKDAQEAGFTSVKKALCIPLSMEGIGDLEITVLMT